MLSKIDRSKQSQENYEKYDRICRESGVVFTPDTPKRIFGITIEEAWRRFQEDENLNNIRLKKWDTLSYSFIAFHRPKMSLAEVVCMYKHAFRVMLLKWAETQRTVDADFESEFHENIEGEDVKKRPVLTVFVDGTESVYTDVKILGDGCVSVNGNDPTPLEDYGDYKLTWVKECDDYEH